MSRGNWLSEKGSDSGVAQGGVSHGLMPCRALERVQRAATADKRGCRSVVFAPVDWVLLQRDHCQIVLSVVLGEGEEGRDGKGWMQGDMLVGRARNPTTYSTSLPTHTLFPPAARAHPPPVIAAAVHMEMAVAPGRREALGSCHGISCVAESLVCCRTTTRPGRARDRRCSVGARWTSVWTTANMCVCCMCVHVCAA